MMENKREIWVDYVKIFACTLVVTGHFFQSMISSKILLETELYNWFNTTIYFFHVPLFFICSGYLYQKKNCVNSFLSWKENLIKKALSLGVPYFVFSIFTWVMKALFSGHVNAQNKDLLTSLFLSPISPYWYLYSLFFIFLITPTFKNKKWACTGLLGALLLKIVSMFFSEMRIYAVSTVLANEVWFVLGMYMDVIGVPQRTKLSCGKMCIIVSIVFILSSSVIYCKNHGQVTVFLMGLLGCFSAVAVIMNIAKKGYFRTIVQCVSKFTMPVFLMHTIFAAGIRSVLLRAGIENYIVHIVCGLTISFVGPIGASIIMERIKLDVLIYPQKYICIRKE